MSSGIVLPWAIPGGQFDVAVDGLSAIFLLPIFLISLLGSVYGLGYWKQSEHPENGRKLRLFYGLLTAGMALMVIARNSILFLFGWEIMALSGVLPGDHGRRPAGGPRDGLDLLGGHARCHAGAVRFVCPAACGERFVHLRRPDRG